MKYYSFLPFVFFVSLYLWTNKTHVVSNSVACDVIVDAGPDTSICLPGGTLNLMGSFSGQGIIWEWTPAQGLNDPNSLQTLANVTGDITYTLTVFGIDPSAPDLVTNGDFEQGNAFFTGDYLFVVDDPLSQSEMVPEGTYTVVTSPNLVHTGFSDCSDHTTGTGNMLVLNGAANLQDIWCQTITVNPGTYYNLAAWVTSVNPASPAQLQFSINNTPIGSIFYASSTTCDWAPFNAIWNSENNTTAEICILNLNTQPSGNDFAIDDISFYELCSAEDEVTISIIDEPAPEPNIIGPEVICVDEIYEYIVLLPDSPAIISYEWNISPSGTIVSGQGTDTVFAYWSSVGNREICLDIETRCSTNSSCLPITVDDAPETFVIFGPSEVCQNEIAIYLVNDDPLIENYYWELPPAATLLSGQGTELIEVQWDSDGLADLCLTMSNHCGATTTCVPVEVNPIFWVVIDTMICAGITFEVNGVTYGNGNNIGIEISQSQNNCDSTIEVIVVELDILEVQNPVTICHGDSIWFSGAFQTESGTFNDTTSSSQGCDSVTITFLSIREADTVFVLQSSCIPGEEGIITESYVGTLCDSVVITETILLESDYQIVLLTSCNPADTGVFIQSLFNSAGCDSVIKTVVNFALRDSTFLTSFSCEPGDTGITVQLFQNNFGCDSIIWTNTKLLQADTLYNSEFTCEIQDTGIQIINLINIFGCDSSIITNYIYGGSEPTLLLDSSCSDMDTGIVIQVFSNLNGCDSLVSTKTTLLPSAFVYSEIFTCDSNEVGEFIEYIVNEYGCYDTIVSAIKLLPTSHCMISYDIGLISRCSEDPTFMEVIITEGLAPINVTWKHLDEDILFSSTIDQLNDPDSLLVEREGTYMIVFSWANDQHDTSFINVVFPKPIQIELTVDRGFSGYALACYGDEDASAEFTLLTGGEAPLRIEWSHGDTLDKLISLAAGMYFVTITDAKACQVTDSIIIDAPPPITYTLTHSDVGCYGQSDGAISIHSLSGGVPEISIWIADIRMLTNSIHNLSGGLFPILFIDQNGCAVDDTVQLTEPDELIIELGHDTTIRYGSSYLIRSISNRSFSTIEWIPDICNDCTQFELRPLQTTKYIVEIQDSAGCIAQASQTISIELEKNIYTPNVFSPNGDGINDFFFLSGNYSVMSVLNLEIFDRWGNLVFKTTDSDPGVSESGWDGTFRGVESPAAVYVFTTQIEYIDGTIEFLKGDLTLIR